MILFKKLASLTLSVCMILAGFSVMPQHTAYASDSSCQSDLSFLSSLGITAGIDTSDSDRVVSRAEFVAMAVKIINPNLSIKFTGSFSDVTSETMYSNEIYTALSHGLLNGTSQGTFSPDSPITYAAALKILIAALGYEEYAYINGGYPTGYIMQADAIDLIDGIASYDTNDSLSLESAVSLIANALKCDIRKIMSVTNDYVETKIVYGTNCLTEYFGFKKVSGILSTAGSYSMEDNYFAEESMAQIGDVCLYSDLVELETYLGYSVDGWYDESRNELCALSVSNVNQTVSFDADDTNYNNFEITVEDDNGKTKTYRLDKGFCFVLNGRLISPEASDFTFPEGKITLVDNSGDGRYDVVIAEKKECFVVKSINRADLTVYDKKNSDARLVLKNEDGYFYTLEKDGIAIDPLSLSEEDVLEVYQSSDGFVSKVNVSSEYVKGTITGIGNGEIFVDGKPYEYNEYFKTYFKPELSQTGTFLLDPSGKIAYISSLYKDGVEYGYYLDFAVKTSGLSSERKIKLLTEAGDIEIFELADKIKLDGQLYEKEAPEIQNTLMNGGFPCYQLIRYGVNDEGEVNLIDLASKISDKQIDASLSETDKLLEKYSENYSVENNLTKYVDASETSAYWRKTGSAFFPFFTVGDTILISVPKAIKPEKGSPSAYTTSYDDDAFSITSTDSLDAYGSYYVDAYDYDENMTAKVVVIYDRTVEAGKANPIVPQNSATVHVVASVNDVITADGEPTKRIYAYADKKFVSYEIDPSLCSAFEMKGLIPSSGDVVRFSMGAKYINGIAIDAVYNPTTASLTVNYTNGVSTDPGATLTYVTGRVFSYSGVDSLAIKTDNYPGHASYPIPADNLCSVMASSSTQVVVYDTKIRDISHGRMDDLTDIRSAGADDASYVCVRLNGYSPKLIVIYK